MLGLTGRIVLTAALVGGGLGCNALAGLEEGQLVATDSGGTLDGNPTGDSGGSTDGANGGDTTTTDGGADGTMSGGDSSTMSDTSTGPTDAATEEASPPTLPVGCTVNPNTTLLVQDLSVGASDSGNTNLQFQRQMWMVPASIGDGTYLVAQQQSDSTDFTLYQVDFSQRQVSSTALGGSDGGSGVRVLDVESTPGGPAAFITHQASGSSQQALEMVSLPSSWNGASGSTTAVSGLLPANTNGSGGTFTSPTSGLFYWIYSAQNGSNNQLMTGSSTMASLTLFQSSTVQYNGSNIPLFDLGGNLYAFVQGLGDAGGSTVLAYPDNFANTGVQAPVASSQQPSTILSAHVSATDSTKAHLLGLGLDQTTGGGQVWSGNVAPGSLTSLSLGPPQFSAGSQLSISELPFDNGNTTWFGDQTFVVGTPQGGGSSLLLLWFGPEGRAIVHPQEMGPLLTRSNAIVGSAIGVSNAFGEVDASFFVAWIEEIVPDSGPIYNQLWAARVTCTTLAGD